MAHYNDTIKLTRKSRYEVMKAIEQHCLGANPRYEFVTLKKRVTEVKRFKPRGTYIRSHNLKFQDNELHEKWIAVLREVQK